MVQCRICGCAFKAINRRHLTKHGVSLEDYKEQFPDAEIESTELSAKRRAAAIANNEKLWNISSRTPKDPKVRVAWNKDKKLNEDTKVKLSSAARERYKTGTAHPMLGKTHTEESKKRISEKNKGKKISIEQLEKQAAKLAIYRVSAEYVPPMLGKSHTAEARARISIKSAQSAEKRRSSAQLALASTLCADGITVLAVSAEDVHLRCNTCSSTFSFARQYFTNSKKENHRSRSEQICPKCFPRIVQKSKKELDILEFVKEHYHGEVISGDREVLFGKELDIYLPALNLGIEFCGIYWHSELISHRAKYHIAEKRELCESNKIRLITIFEDEWDFKQDIVKSRLMNILGSQAAKIYARKTVIKKITAAQSTSFLNLNHIQGADKPYIALGAFHDDKLISVMTFKRTSFVKGGDGTMWELNRFASKKDIRIVGMASKFLKYFLKNHNQQNLQVISYSDNRWSQGSVYETLGFAKIDSSKPSYWYAKIGRVERLHRARFMRFKLNKVFDKPEYSKDVSQLSENEIMQQEGYTRIWDCGHTKWILKP